MIRVGITGVPGAGKTTLSRSIAAECRGIETLKKVELVQEYARRYILKHGSITSILEQYRILEKQCGFDKYIASMCFHHKDPKIKDFEIGDNCRYTLETLKKEVDKCALLCCNCHNAIHSNELTEL